MGGFTLSSGGNCAGQATLSGGAATIRDACFSGADNVVLCTDTSAVSAVRCTPAAGELDIAGSAGDVVAYARIR
jgi:hypothetical protein